MEAELSPTELIANFKYAPIQPCQMERSFPRYKKKEVLEGLALSLAPMAKLLGKERADQLLLPVFQRFLQNPYVQNVLIGQIYDFCEVLSAEGREAFLRELNQMLSMDVDTRCWRLRVEFAIQLTQLIPLFPIELINKYLCAYALTFAADRISEVRIYGIGMLALVLGTFVRFEWEANCGDRDDWTRRDGHNCDAIPVTSSDCLSRSGTDAPLSLPLSDKLLAEIRQGFWRTRSWRRRQSFGHLLYLLIQRELVSNLQFFYLFFHDLMCLSDDDIPNVRQYFCLLAQLNRFEKYVGVSVRNRLEYLACDDADLEIRNLSKIALGILDPSVEGVDISRRARGLV